MGTITNDIINEKDDFNVSDDSYSRLKEIFKKNKLTYETFKKKLVSIVGVGSKNSEFTLYTPLFKRVLENAVIEAREQNSKNVSPEIIIISILNEEDGVAWAIEKWGR